jgi:hypothetical protein
MFRDAVREFREERVRPLVHKMDEEANIPRPSSTPASSSA